MKKFICTLALALSMASFAHANKGNDVKVAIDLVNVKDDKVMVTVTPQPFKTDNVTFFIPKTVPGTYSADNYGQYIEGFKAYDAKGKELTVTHDDLNSWKIAGAKKLAKVTYWVNDTFDGEAGKEDKVFSPAGTNIIAGKNFMLNTHGFVGYFEGAVESPYEVTITHPADLWAATSMTDIDKSNTVDVFKTKRYAELVDHPIMYSKPDYTTFKVDDMEIVISVFSPSGKIKAADITPEMETMMRAQKKFLGPTNATKKYCILLYLSTVAQDDAQGFGALEHPTSTTVVMPEQMEADYLKSTLKDVVSHEFFHIVTPLTVHSKEIQFFDFNNPKMSEHLWMYEGITEYFANLFQINQGLITEEEFYQRLATKINNAKNYNDTMPFTQMSRNVLEAPYKDQYANVYEKGALIAMCIDIQMRESSGGKEGILSLMRKLGSEYGDNKPFNDSELFAKVTSLSYPAVGEFLNKYVAGNTPINYEEYFAKMGVVKASTTAPGHPFIKGEREAYININKDMKIFLTDVTGNKFFETLGLKQGDVLLAANGTEYGYENVYDLLEAASQWKEGDDITIKYLRDGKEAEAKGKVTIPTMTVEAYTPGTDAAKAKLREAWLKG
ncbi:peptidase M61 [Flavobacterium akiainvivens]|uniref:Peptidase M61 n=1 Tax=Flavobacterium akiainvivens TaxID=1202724 RepID=A0A0M9VI62_9FLAO|nr:PDZ domain-containing protein [Flavobacterium akiainvivens]KOS06302.1 peptidase M61 [Flavobacterium akiainvivens]SFQ16812.1 Predicted metalloprotease, contains C-terminal PDZ domain [Flavobacterium akiainvivens]